MKPESLRERFRVEDVSLRGLPLMDAVCRGRGFLAKGGEYDYDRCCAVVLDEFRGGKLGRITLEMPERKESDGAYEPDGPGGDPEIL